jgi:hypothetical protein
MHDWGNGGHPKTFIQRTKRYLENWNFKCTRIVDEWVIEQLQLPYSSDVHVDTEYACEAIQYFYCVHIKASRGFEPRSLDSESRVLTVTPRGQVINNTVAIVDGFVADLPFTMELTRSSFMARRVNHHLLGSVKRQCYNLALCCLAWYGMIFRSWLHVEAFRTEVSSISLFLSTCVCPDVLQRRRQFEYADA